MGKTVIDELTVAISLDPTGFAAGAKQVQETIKTTKTHVNELGETVTTVNTKVFKEEKEKQEANKKTAESYGAVTTAIYRLTAAYLGAKVIKSFVIDVTNADAATYRLGKNLGVSTNNLKALQGVFGKFGSSAEDVDSTMRHIQGTFMSTITGGNESSFFTAMGRLGMNANDFVSAKDDMERLKLIQEAFGKNSQQTAQYFGQQAGFSEATVNALYESNGQLDEMLAAYQKRNPLTDADGKAAIELKAAWVDVTAEVQGMGRVLLEDVNPALVGTLGFVGKIAEGFKLMLNGKAEKNSRWYDIRHMLGVPDDFDPEKAQKDAAHQQALDVEKKATTPDEKKRNADFDAKLKARFAPGNLHAKLTNLGADITNELGAYKEFADLLARGESGKGGYDAVNLGKANGGGASTVDSSNMTFDEVVSAQHAGTFKAFGRYQQMEESHREAKAGMNLTGEEKMTPQMQDKIFVYNLEHKRKKLAALLRGEGGSYTEALSEASNEWRAFENPSSGYRMGTKDKSGQNSPSISAGEFMDAVHRTRDFASSQQRVASSGASSSVNNNTASTTAINGPITINAGNANASELVTMLTQEQAWHASLTNAGGVTR